MRDAFHQEQLDVPVPGLAPGESLTVEKTWANLSDPVLRFVAAVDPENQVPECNEENNQRMRALCVTCDRFVFLPLAVGELSP